MVSLRQLAAADAAMQAKMGGQSLLESHGHSASAAIMNAYVSKSFTEEACRAELLNEANIFYAAFYNNKPAGYFKIVFDVPHKGGTIQPVTKLERLYLLKEFYGLKLGNLLMKEAIALSKAAGEKGMWLNVWKENERAIRFYRRQGFVIVGESEFVLTAEHSNPNWVMELVY